jgi:ComF family protein
LTATLPRKPPPRIDPLSPILRRIESFLFPPLCFVCDRPRKRERRWLCEGCLHRITSGIVSRKGCPHCGQNREIRACACDIAWDFPFERIISFVDYDDTIRAIMHHVKYRGVRRLARYLGQVCAPYLDKDIIATHDFAVPVPLHWLRRQRRGYNQAEAFARGLFEDGAGPKVHSGLLRRVRRTQTQTKLDKSDRRMNVAGAFALTPAAMAVVKGKAVLLVDDVITTGATAAAAAKALLDGGCGGVTVVSLARD